MYILMYCQGSVVEQAAAREHLEDGETEQRGLERHHRDPARLETKVRVGAGEKDADNKSDDDGSELYGRTGRSREATSVGPPADGYTSSRGRRTVSSSSSSPSPTCFLTCSRGRDSSNLSRLLRDPVVRAIFLSLLSRCTGQAIRRGRIGYSDALCRPLCAPATLLTVPMRGANCKRCEA